MKFLIDENLPVKLTNIVISNGFHAIHVNQVKTEKNRRISDQQLNKLSIYKDYIIVTRDDDFVKTYVSRKVPDKLIYLFSNGKKDEIISLFEKYFHDIVNLLGQFDFIELNKNGIKTPFDNDPF